MCLNHLFFNIIKGQGEGWSNLTSYLGRGVLSTQRWLDSCQDWALWEGQEQEGHRRPRSRLGGEEAAEEPDGSLVKEGVLVSSHHFFPAVVVPLKPTPNPPVDF